MVVYDKDMTGAHPLLHCEYVTTIMKIDRTLRV